MLGHHPSTQLAWTQPAALLKGSFLLCVYNSFYLFYCKLQGYLNEDVSSALGKTLYCLLEVTYSFLVMFMLLNQANSWPQWGESASSMHFGFLPQERRNCINSKFIKISHFLVKLWSELLPSLSVKKLFSTICRCVLRTLPLKSSDREEAGMRLEKTARKGVVFHDGFIFCVDAVSWSAGSDLAPSDTVALGQQNPWTLSLRNFLSLTCSFSVCFVLLSYLF